MGNGIIVKVIIIFLKFLIIIIFIYILKGKCES